MIVAHGCESWSIRGGGPHTCQKLGGYNPGSSGKCSKTSCMSSGHAEQSSSWKILEIWPCWKCGAGLSVCVSVFKCLGKVSEWIFWVLWLHSGGSRCRKETSIKNPTKHCPASTGSIAKWQFLLSFENSLFKAKFIHKVRLLPYSLSEAKGINIILQPLRVRIISSISAIVLPLLLKSTVTKASKIEQKELVTTKRL